MDKILWVDLFRNEMREEQLNDKIARDYLGGYILTGGCQSTETKNPYNFRVFMEAAVEYGTY